MFRLEPIHDWLWGRACAFLNWRHAPIYPCAGCGEVGRDKDQELRHTGAIEAKRQGAMDSYCLECCKVYIYWTPADVTYRCQKDGKKVALTHAQRKAECGRAVGRMFREEEHFWCEPYDFGLNHGKYWPRWVAFWRHVEQ